MGKMAHCFGAEALSIRRGWIKCDPPQSAFKAEMPIRSFWRGPCKRKSTGLPIQLPHGFSQRWLGWKANLARRGARSFAARALGAFAGATGLITPEKCV